MKNTTIRAIFASGLLLACANKSQAMRCEHGIVDTGYTIQQVIAACGTPTFETSDVWGDKVSLTYKLDGGNAIWTVWVLNNVVSDIDMSRP